MPKRCTLSGGKTQKVRKLAAFIRFGAQKVNCRKAAREAPLGGAAEAGMEVKRLRPLDNPRLFNKLIPIHQPPDLCSAGDIFQLFPREEAQVYGHHGIGEYAKGHG